MDYLDFFQAATEHVPYPYQTRFAIADQLPHLLRAPTGAGKTATAILGWLFRRLVRRDRTPRRLVYCLPMRVLVEQSVREARDWIENLKSYAKKRNLKDPLVEAGLSVQVFMGGVALDEEAWFLHPERPTILIGTQDMLLSRALNRGFGASRFHWPIDFGLLNNDCLWIYDEPQLMAGGVATSAQLAGLRKKLKTIYNCPSVWMSATLEPNWLDTIDFKGEFPAEALELDKHDYDKKLELHNRMTAEKTLSTAGVKSTKDMKDAAKKILAAHKIGTKEIASQTLVVVNTVERAKAVYAELSKLNKKDSPTSLLLVHSRFRPAERATLNEELQNKEPGDRVIIATQVVEAGVDISARRLITELAPWPSLVQRMGRCNRTGRDGPGEVFWLELDDKSNAPYEEEDLKEARGFLKKLNGKGVSPKELDDFKADKEFELRFEHKHVLRRRDLVDLFDTMPDLSGNDIDVARFVRSDDESSDVQVFWREIASDDPNKPEPQAAPDRCEMCRVPIYGPAGLQEFLKKSKHDAYLWDHFDDAWRVVCDPPRELRPGLQVMLPVEAGGYSKLLGWDPDSKSAVAACLLRQYLEPEGMATDPNSQNNAKLTIAEHTNNVCRELAAMLDRDRDGIRLPKSWEQRLMQAARWHDVGKAHEVFHNAMKTLNGDPVDGQHWAKSGHRGRLDYGRKYFRHELASALAGLQQGLPFPVAYLIAAHHGRPRISIRALPDESEVDAGRIADVRAEWNRDPLFALGVWDRDTFGPVDLGGEFCPQIALDLSPMQLGGELSWTARALELLEELGPFRLAYLEALLRAADMRASREEAKNNA